MKIKFIISKNTFINWFDFYFSGRKFVEYRAEDGGVNLCFGRDSIVNRIKRFNNNAEPFTTTRKI